MLRKFSKPAYGVIDRFEGDYAVVEMRDTDQMVDIPRKDVPANAKESDVIVITDGKITIDVAETKRLKAEIDELMKDIWEK